MKINNSKLSAGIVSFLMLAILFSSCMDEPGERRVNKNIETINELTAASTFDWKTSNKVEVLISSLPVEVSVNRKLSLMASDGNVFYAGLQSMNEDFKMDFELPSHLEEVTMVYGDIRKSAEIIGGKVIFDYITETNTDDIED